MNQPTHVLPRLALAAVTLALVAGSGAAPAQSADAAQTSDTGTLEEVIVTATKRNEAITDVPVAIQVFGSEQLEKFGIDSFADYAQYAPGVSFTRRGPGQTHVVIRGLSTGNVGNGQPQNRALAGIYLDDVPVQLNGYNFDPDLFDIARVEVLKGPQGTLFGDSAMAGAIRYVTTPPNLEQSTARVNLNGSSTHEGGGNYAVRGTANLPLVAGKLALRAVAWHIDNDGWIDSTRTGESDINTEKTTGGRVSLRYVPSERFNMQAMLLAQRTRTGGRPESDENVGPLEQDRFAEPFKDDALFANLTLNWALGNANLTSVTGYLDRDLNNVATTIERTIRDFFGITLPNDRLVDPWKQEFLTQEVRLTSSGERRMDYTFGIFAARQVINYPTYGFADGFAQAMVDIGVFPSLADFNALGCAPPELPDHYFCGSLDTTQKQIAGFGDITWHLSGRLDLLVGARYFDWKQDFTEAYAGFFNGGPTFKQQTIKENGVNPRYGFTYSLGGDNMLFVSGAKGFRLGGVNDPLPYLCDQDVIDAGISAADRFDKDSLWTYEVGVKTMLSSRRVAFNASVFQTDWDDVQTNRGLDCGYSVTQNAGKVVSRGLEFDTTIAAAQGLRFMLSGSYTDAKLDEDSQSLGAVKGDRVPFVPRWKAAAFVAYDFPVSAAWQGFMNAGVTTQSSSFSAFSPLDPNRLEIPSSTVGTLRVGMQSARYQVALFADNITDERVLYNSLITNGIRNFTYARPRTLGLELDVRFN